MMSTIAPRVHRTSFVSAAGGNWKVHSSKRSLALVEGDVRLRDQGLQPVVGELVLAEGPREKAPVVLSPLRSRMNAPRSSVSVKINLPPWREH